MKMTLANQITLLRLLLVPVIVIGLLQGLTIFVVILLCFCMLTDFLDGLVARHRDERTNLGAFLDPMADKLLLTALYLTLTVKGLIPVWVFVVIFSRDLLFVLGWGIIYILTKTSHIHPRILGKTATAIQMGMALALILSVPPMWIKPLVWIVVATTILSAVDYIILAEKRLGVWN